jgi:threonine synthase
VSAPTLVCTVCDATATDLLAARCPACCGMLRWRLGRITPADVELTTPGAWRYGAALPPVPKGARRWLGAGMTPLHQPAPGWPTLKLESLYPTGSYKERGASLLVSALAGAHPGQAIYDDSSGNAGAALAAYGRVAGLPVTVLAPADTAPGKLALIRALGATVEAVPGDRAEVGRRALERSCEPPADTAGSVGAVAPADSGATGDRAGAHYASHIWHPLFVAGCATALLEIWEQRDFSLPAEIVLACGYGSQVLGAMAALEALDALDGRCRIVAVQSQAYPALWEAWRHGRSSTTPVRRGSTVAEGITCVDPPRGAELLAGIRASGGRVGAVDDTEIAGAVRSLAAAGHLVEPTGAVALAGWRQGAEPASRPIGDPADTVVVLSGSGLKTLPETARLLEP